MAAPNLWLALDVVYRAMHALKQGDCPVALQAAIDQARAGVAPVEHSPTGQELALLLREVERCRDTARRQSVDLDSMDQKVARALFIELRSE